MSLRKDGGPVRESVEPQVREPWSGQETLRCLAELNEQCLALLAEQAERPPPGAVTMLREVADLWARMDEASRARAARCPFLLFDAGFTDPVRWRWAVGPHVGELPPPGFSTFFTIPDVSKVAQQVLTTAWHIVRTQPMGAALYLGMPGYCVNAFRACSIRQLTRVAELYGGWLRPRWSGRVRVWRQLLLAAMAADEPALERARMHGVQLLATEIRALEQVHENANR
ncbi:MAG TPA: hypothetical protein VMT29_07690 [Steroidobacteraceae bacterium]|nr:hypothetical protein [Steroidobacteraceae bacterium]